MLENKRYKKAISLSPAGYLYPFYGGVMDTFQEKGVLKDSMLYGVSSGAIVGVLSACNISVKPHCEKLAHLYNDSNSPCCPYNVSINHIAENIPDDAYIRCFDRVAIGYTSLKLRKIKNKCIFFIPFLIFFMPISLALFFCIVFVVYIVEVKPKYKICYENNKELINTLYVTSSIPLINDSSKIRKLDDEYGVDGGFIMSNLISNDIPTYTIDTCPYRNADIITTIEYIKNNISVIQPLSCDKTRHFYNNGVKQAETYLDWLN